MRAKPAARFVCFRKRFPSRGSIFVSSRQPKYPRFLWANQERTARRRLRDWRRTPSWFAEWSNDRVAKMRVLVIEDDRILNRQISSALGGIGYVVDSSWNGAQG